MNKKDKINDLINQNGSRLWKNNFSFSNPQSKLS